MRRVLRHDDAKAYHALPYREKAEVEQAVAAVNSAYRTLKGNMALFAPGRVGTSSPELGVPLAFSELSHFSAVIEYDDAESGFQPELSFGSHLFQDLVENDIFYTALFSSGPAAAVFDLGLLDRLAQRVDAGVPNKMRDIVKVYDTTALGLTLWYDMVTTHVFCGFPRA